MNCFSNKLTVLLPMALVLCTGLMIEVTASEQPADDQPTANVRWFKGSYEYGVVNDGGIRGHEDWVLTVHPDGTRTVQTFVDLRDLGHQSSAILRVDQRFRPLGAHLEFWRFGQFGGSGHYWLEPATGGGSDIVHGRVIGPDRAHSFEMAVPDKITLRIHPVILEGWLVWYHDNSGPTQQRGEILNVVTTNDVGPKGLGQMQENVTRYLGQESIATPAGTFDTDHYSLYDGRYEVWLWGEDRIAVRYLSPAAGREYRLVRLEQGPDELLH